MSSNQPVFDVLFNKKTVQAKVSDGWLVLTWYGQLGLSYNYRVNLQKVSTLGMVIIPKKLDYSSFFSSIFTSAIVFYFNPLQPYFNFDVRWISSVAVVILGTLVLFLNAKKPNIILKITTDAGETVELDGGDWEMSRIETYLWESIQRERGFII